MSYTLDLSKIFVDVNGDELTYQVSVNGAKAAAAAPSYTYTPDAAGTVTLAFTASDGALTSEPYTVTLHVNEKGHAYPFEFKGLHSAQLSDIKVYTYTDGVKGGFDLEMLEAVCNAVSVPVIASGGAGKVEDFTQLFQTLPGVDAGLAASVFHFGQIAIPDLKAELRKNGILVR